MRTRFPSHNFKTSDFPFLLVITVDRAEAIASVSDEGSLSNLFVVGYSDGIEIGRTCIAYNNNNPTWNTSLPVLPLIHTKKGPLLFYVYNYEPGVSDTLVGEAFIDFSVLAPNGIESKHITTVTLNNKSSKLLLHVSLTLSRNHRIFEMRERADTVILTSDTAYLLRREMDSIRMPAPSESPEQIVMTHVAHELEASGLFSVERVRDLLFDVRNIDEADFTALSMTLLKRDRLPTGSTGYSVFGAKFSQRAPMDGLCLRLIDDNEDGITLTTKSRHLLWRWMRAVIVSFTILNNNDFEFEKYADLLLSSDAGVRNKEGQLASCACSITHTAPFDLMYGGAKFDLSSVAEVTLSLDCTISTEFCVDVSVYSVEGVETSTDIKDLSLLIKGHSQFITSKCLSSTPHQVWSDRLEFDVSVDDLNKESMGVHVFLFDVKNAVLLGEQFVSIANLLDIEENGHYSEESVVDGKILQSYLSLNMCTSLVLCNMEVTGLPLLETQVDVKFRDIFIICSFYQPHTLSAFQEFRSMPVLGSRDVDFSVLNLELLSSAGLYRASYVRLRFFSTDDRDASEQLIGEAFIPVSDFTSREQNREYSIVDHAVGCLPSDGFSPSKISLTMFQRIENIECPYSVNLFARGSRSNEFKTKWQADCLPVVGQREWHIPALKFCVFPDYDSLVLADVAAQAELAQDPSPKTVFFGLNKYNSMNGRESSSGGILTLYYYENQRRQVKPPFDWGSEFLTKADPPSYSDESGTRQYCFETFAPEGYEWRGPAEPEISSEHVDEEGWSYDLTFSDLRNNFRKNSSSSLDTPALLVRRRKMIRHAKLAGNRRHSVQVDYRNSRGHKSKGIFRESVDLSFEGCMKYCKEKKSLLENIRVPWSQVLDVRVVTPALLIIQLTLHKYIGKDKSELESFLPEKVDVFILNCCAVHLKALIDERIELCPLRSCVVRVVGHTGLLRHTHSTDTSAANEASALNEELLQLGSKTLSTLEEEILKIIPPRDSLISHSPSTPRPSLDAFRTTGQSPPTSVKKQDSSIKSEKFRARLRNPQAAYTKMRECRLRLYVAALICNSLKADHEYTVEDVEVLIRDDLATVKEIHDSRGEIESIRARVESIKMFSKSRIRNIYLTGWKRKVDQGFIKSLLLFIHEYTNMAVSLYGECLDGPKSKYLKDSSKKVDFLYYLSCDDAFLEQIVKDLLETYGLFVTPSPTITNALFISQIIFYFVSEMKRDFDEALDAILATWRARVTNSLPWKPLRRTRSGTTTGPYQSTMVEELKTAILPMCESLNRDFADRPILFQQDMHVFRRRVEMAYVNTYSRLAWFYSSMLSSNDWASIGEPDRPDPQNLLSERQAWLSSIVNDCYRVSRDAMVTVAAPEVKSLKGPHATVVERTRKVYGEYDKIATEALEALSCIVFQRCRNQIIDFNPSWDVSLKSGVNGPIHFILASLTDSFDLMKKIISNQGHYKSLVRVCAIKMVVAVLSFVRDKTVPFTPEERVQMGKDINFIHDSFSVFVEKAEAAVMDLDMHMKRLRDVYSLINEDPTSQQFVNTTRKFLGESRAEYSDSVALSLLLDSCIRARDWEGFDMHKSPAQELVEILQSNAKAPGKPLAGKKLSEFSIEVRVFKMPAVSLLTQLTKSCIPDLGSRVGSVYSPTIQRKVKVNGLKVRDLITTSENAPDVYVAMSTELVTVTTPTRESTCNPSWYDDNFELTYTSDYSLVPKSKVKVEIFFKSKDSVPMLFGSCSVLLEVSDDLTGPVGKVNSALDIGVAHEARLATGKGITMNAPVARVYFNFTLVD